MSDNFAADLMRRVLASMMMDSNITKADPLALEYLTDYTDIEEIGRQAKNNAELAGRSDSHVFDVLRGMDQLGINVVDELSHRTSFQPFSRVIPPFRPASVNCVTEPSYVEYQRAHLHLQLSERSSRELFHASNLMQPKPQHVPSHAPPLPIDFTYRCSRVDTRRLGDDKARVGRQAAARGEMKETLATILDGGGNEAQNAFMLGGREFNEESIEESAANQTSGNLPAKRPKLEGQ